MRAILVALVGCGLLAPAALARQPRPPDARPGPSPAAALQTLGSAHFEVAFTLPPAQGKGYAALCERAYGRFCDILNVPDGEAVWDGKCKVFLFGTPAEFVRFAVALGGPAVAQSGGFARPTKREPLIVMPMYGQERVHLEQVLIHEMTHVFLQLYRKEVNLPTWLQEGCAQFFEFMHHPEDSRLRQSRALAKALVAADQARPLRDFWVKPFPPTDRAGYAQAWSLIHYLSQGTKTKGKIGKFVLKIKELTPDRTGVARIAHDAAHNSYQIQAEAFQQVFGTTVEDFERAWKQFVLATY